jgi:hypothetical protein
MDNQNKSVPDLGFLSDKPTHDDQLGTHKKIAESLKTFIEGDLPKPFVIGLFGTWGAGKSSIVKMLEASDNRTFKIVVVDAWRKDKDNFLRQFTKKLARNLLPNELAKEVCKKVDFKISSQDVRWVPSKLADVTFAIYILTALMLLFGTIYNWFVFPNYPAKDIGEFAFLIIAAIFLQYLLPKYSKNITTETEDITIEDPARFREIYFEDILNKGSGVTICVVIDNLDRVPADDAFAIIKLIKTFIVDADYEQVSDNKNKIVFLIPCDERELRNRVEESIGGTSNQFLQKFINVSLQIPSLLDQDNISYIRGLIDMTGLQAESQPRDNLAFIVSRVCNDNPRKPKAILNHFVARYNLATKFPDCSIVQSRPDWYAIYTIMEYENFTIPENIESVKSTQGYAGNGASFLNSVLPIASEITQEAWHTFLYLKKPNIHDLVPGFNDMVKYALERNSEKFNEVFFKLVSKHYHLITDLWSERTDNQSRMAFAERILFAYEVKAEKFVIPPVVLSGTATLIQMSIAGIGHLPPDSTYELVLKSNKGCLKSLLSTFCTSTFNAVDEASAKFMQNIICLTIRDFHNTQEFQSDISQVLDMRTKNNVALAKFAMNYPQYSSNVIFQTCLDATLHDIPEIQPMQLGEYIKSIATLNPAHADNCLNLTANALAQKLKEIFTSNNQKPIYYELAYELTRARVRLPGNSPMQFWNSFFSVFLGQYSPLVNRAHWESAYLILASSLELSKSPDVNLKSQPIPFNRQTVRGFIQNAPDEFVEKLCGHYAASFGDEDFRTGLRDGLQQASLRSVRLATCIFRKFPTLRPNILIVLIQHRATWLQEIAANLANDETLSQDFGINIVNQTAGNPNEQLYASIGKLKNRNDDFKTALVHHFDNRLRSANLTVIANMENALKSMSLASYKPNEAQKGILREAIKTIPHDHLTEAQRKLFDESFAN